MKIHPDLLVSLQAGGRLTLQIPGGAVIVGYEDGEFRADLARSEYAKYLAGTQEFPDEWFCRTKLHGTKKALVIGKESGSLHWSEKGWQANKQLILNAFRRGVAKVGGVRGLGSHRDVSNQLIQKWSPKPPLDAYSLDRLFEEFAAEWFAELRMNTQKVVDRKRKDLADAEKALAEL